MKPEISPDVQWISAEFDQVKNVLVFKWYFLFTVEQVAHLTQLTQYIKSAHLIKPWES